MLWTRRGLLLGSAMVFGAVVLLIFGAERLLDSFTRLDESPFAARYHDHAWMGALHMVPGLVFVCAAPLQFLPAIRRRWPALHRGLGRVLLVLGLVSGVYAIALALALPAFGGVGTLTATLLFGAVFLFSLVRAWFAIRARQVAAHRRWMIRAVALGFGVATIRALVGLSQAFTDVPFEAAFPWAFWAGLGINAAAAEAWLRRFPNPPRG